MLRKLFSGWGDGTEPAVRFGEMMEPQGREVAFEGAVFRAGQVRLEGETPEPEFRLKDFAAGREIPEPARWTGHDWREIIWLRGRIHHLFRAGPMVRHPGREFGHVYGFVARLAEQPDAVPFLLTGGQRPAELAFSPAETDAARKAAVANAFWGLLLADSAATDYKDAANWGHDIIIGYGVKDGRPFETKW